MGLDKSYLETQPEALLKAACRRNARIDFCCLLKLRAAAKSDRTVEPVQPVVLDWGPGEHFAIAKK